MSSNVNKVLFEAAERKLETARESYSKYRSTMEDLNKLLDAGLLLDMQEFGIQEELCVPVSLHEAVAGFQPVRQRCVHTKLVFDLATHDSGVEFQNFV